MRLTHALIAGALLTVPTLSFAEKPREQMSVDPQRNNDARTSEQARNYTGSQIPGLQGTLPAQGREIVTRPAGAQLKRSTVTGRIVASDDHQLILQDGVGAEQFDVHRLAFTRSLKTGELVTVQMKDDGQSPDKIYLVGASSTLGPIAAEPTP
jgi:hypothetical protein